MHVQNESTSDSSIAAVQELMEADTLCAYSFQPSINPSSKGCVQLSTAQDRFDMHFEKTRWIQALIEHHYISVQRSYAKDVSKEPLGRDGLPVSVQAAGLLQQTVYLCDQS